MKLEWLDSHASDWQSKLDTLYQALNGGANPTLLPYHFLQAALPTIGGRVARVIVEEQSAAILFILPYLAIQKPNQSAYVARLHPLPHTPTLNGVQLQSILDQTFTDSTITPYDPAAPHSYQATSQMVGALDIGHPSEIEASAIRTVQQQIWGSPPEYLYPTDIHSCEFPLGTSLVARVEGQLAGFLFGFYREVGPPLPGDWAERWRGNMRIESQVMGVLPAYRGLRISYLLKRIQAAEALAQGIGIIHWTVDPLQYTNAALNFGLLRAMAFTFTPDYYPFRNELNRGPASRLSLTWLIGSARVQGQPLHDARSIVLDMDHHPEIVCVNDGWQRLDFAATAPMLALEIPANWTQLQQQTPEDALAWRTATDQLFTNYIGSINGKYVVTDVGVEAERRYLILQRVSDALRQQLEGM